MLGRILGAGDLGRWASFVTPAFFDVVSAKASWPRFKELARASRDRELYATVVSERRELIARSSLAVELAGNAAADSSLVPRRAASPAESGIEPSGVEARAAQVVELYFHQLLHGRATLLDLRREAFLPGAPLRWRPAAWLVIWDVSFLGALRQLYTGFYRGDTVSFRAALGALNLSSAEAVFRHHFGDGQRSVRFRVRDFVGTFHQVFSSCREARAPLHPDFLPLGLYLATLYDHLEQLGASVDVFTAFQRATELGSGAHPTNRSACLP